MVDDAMTGASEPPKNASLPPIVLALIGVGMGCVMDAIIKHLGATYTAVVVGFWRYAFGTVVAGAAFLYMRRQLPDWAGLRRHAVRTIASTLSAVLFFHSLSILPIAEATVF